MKKLFTLLTFLLTSIVVHATLIIPPDDMGEMAKNAELVVYAQAVSHADNNEYINNFNIIEVINGNAAIGENIQVAEYSGEDENGRRFIISGDVDFKIGTKYLLFLSMNSSGYYKLQYLSLSSFEEGSPDGVSKILAHDQSLLDMYLFDESMKDAHGLSGAYYANTLIEHLKDVVDGTTNWDINSAGIYFLGIDDSEKPEGNNDGTNTKSQAPCPNNAPCHCSTLFGVPGANQTKYVDNTWTVCVAGGASDDPTTTTEITDLQTAITAMNNMPGINISYTGIDAACSPSVGCTNASNDALACAGGFGNNCNKMFVFFDDPCDQIADVDGFCAGTLGIGGHFAGAATHTDACGDTWVTACNPFFVMNDFSGCLPNTVSQNDYVAVLTHEMLHAVGIGHHYGAQAFTTTAAGDNSCGTAGANNPASAPTGTINHNGSECTGLMNPVICNSPAPAPPTFSITALDNACTDWMYNITSSTTCNITNVTLNTAPTCSGDDASFEVCFDVTDGSGAYDIEVAGLVVNNAAAGATDGNVCITATRTGPASGGTFTVNVRDDATFSCLDDTNLQVTFPECPTPCATTCADASTNGCSTSITADNTTPTSTADFTQNCQQTTVVATTASPASITQCYEYTATQPAFFISDFGSILSFTPTDCGYTTTSVIVSEPGCTNPVDVTPAPGFLAQFSGANIGTTYTVCVTGEVSTTGDDCEMSCLNHAITPIAPSCDAVTATPTFQASDICAGDNFVITPSCNYGGLLFQDEVSDPVCTGANAILTDYLFVPAINVFDSDPDTNPGASIIGFDDALNNTCDNITIAAANFPNITCQPINYTVYAQAGFDVYCFDNNTGTVGNYLGTDFQDCPVIPITFTVYPSPSTVNVDDGTSCGTPSVNFVAADNTVCATQTKTAVCADNNDSFAYDFATDATDDGYDGTWIASAPTNCVTASGTINCSNCVVVACPSQPTASSDVNDVCTGGNATLTLGFTTAGTGGSTGSFNLSSTPAGATFAPVSPAAEGNVTVSFPANNSCAPIDYVIAIDAVCSTGDDITGDPANITITVYPQPAVTVVDDGTSCGTPSANLVAVDNTICATQTKTAVCADNNDSFAYDFATDAADDGYDGTWIASAPANCVATVSGTINCSNCPTCPLTPTASSDVNDVCTGGSATLTLGFTTAGTNGATGSFNLSSTPAGATFAPVSPAAEGNVTVSFPANNSCAPIDYVIAIDAVCSTGDDITGDPANITITVYPQPTVTVVDDGTSCGTPSANLVAIDNTICATQTKTAICADNNDSFAYDFATDAADDGYDGTWIASAPANCVATVSGTINCSNCPTCPLTPTASSDVNDVCTGGSATLTLGFTTAGTNGATGSFNLSSTPAGATFAPVSPAAEGNVTVSFPANTGCDPIDYIIAIDAVCSTGDDITGDPANITITVYPDFDANLLMSTQGTCGAAPSLTSTCANYVITIDGDADDITIAPTPGQSGTNNYTITYNNGPNGTSCFSETSTVAYNCNISCPTVTTAISGTESLCSGGTPTLDDTGLLLDDATLAVNVGEVSWWEEATFNTAYVGTALTHSGADNCIAETVILFASVECIDDGSLIAAGSVTITVYPDFDANLLVTVDGDCNNAPSLTSTCANYTITLDGDADDISTIPTPGQSGTNNYTITYNNGPNGTSCFSETSTINYNCAITCPVVNTTISGTEDICSGGTPTLDASALALDDASLAVGNGTVSWWEDATFNTAYSGAALTHSGADNCSVESITLFASIECNDDGSLIVAGSVTINIYPDFDANLLVPVVGDCNTAPSLTSSCANYSIALDGDADDITTVPTPGQSGTNNYTISWSAAPACFTGGTATVAYNCNIACPNVDTAISGTEDICSGGTPTLDASALALDDASLAVGNGTVSWWEDATFNTTYTGGALTHSGADNCSVESITLFASVECSDDGSLIAAGSVTINIYPDFDANLLVPVQGDCTTAPSLTSNCANYTIALDGDADDITTVPASGQSGTNNYTISWISAAPACFTGGTATVTYDCPTTTITYSEDLVGYDPCDCNDDQSANGAGDGTFSELIVIQTDPATTGLTLCVANGASPASLEGQTLTDNNDGSYSIAFNHVDAIGYTLEIADCSDLNTVLVVDNSPFTNTCYYPVIASTVPVTICDTDAALDLTTLFAESGINGDFMGNFTFSSTGSGVSGTSFDPSAASIGMNDITATYTPTAVVGDNPGTIADCVTSLQVMIDVQSCVCEEEINYNVAAVGCDMTGTSIELQQTDGTPITTLPLGVDGGSGTFGLQACGNYQVVITGAPACYTDAGGDVGPRLLTTDGSGSENVFFSSNATDIPTLSEWGLILLALMLMSYGTLGVVASSTQISLNGNMNIPNTRLQLPFNKEVLVHTLMITAIIAAIGFVGSLSLYGAIFMSDIIGVSFAGPVFAYLLHLLWLVQKDHK